MRQGNATQAAAETPEEFTTVNELDLLSRGKPGLLRGTAMAGGIHEVSALIFFTINKTEFAAIEKNAAGAGQVVLARIADQTVPFLRRGPPAQGEVVGRFDLALPLRAHLLQSCRKI